MFCEKCGNQISAQSLFCGKCGAKVNVTQGEAQPQNVYESNQPKSAVNFGVIGFIISLAGIPFVPIYYFATAHTVTSYGWRAYTTYKMDISATVIGIILAITLAAAAVTLAIVGKNQPPKKRNPFIVPTIIISVLVMIVSFSLFISTN